VFRSDRSAVRSGCVGNDRSVARAVPDGPTWNVDDALVVYERGAIVDSMFDDDWSNDSLLLCYLASKNDNVAERMQMSLYRTEVYRISILSTVVVVVCQRRKLLKMCVRMQRDMEVPVGDSERACHETCTILIEREKVNEWQMVAQAMSKSCASGSRWS
jgi:hypothetical protein